MVSLQRGGKWSTRTRVTLFLIAFLGLLICIPLFRPLYLTMLAKMGPAAIPYLINALDDRSEKVRAVTVSSLVRFGPDAIEPLIGTLRDDKTPERREGAAICIWGMAQRAKDDGSFSVPSLVEATPVLRTAFRDEDRRVRVHAARALWLIDGQPDEVIPPLIEAWKEGDNHTRYWAADTLANMGPNAKAAVPVLLEGRQYGDEYMRIWARDALLQIDPHAGGE